MHLEREREREIGAETDRETDNDRNIGTCKNMP